jgi:hypothetical protein
LTCSAYSNIGWEICKISLFNLSAGNAVTDGSVVEILSELKLEQRCADDLKCRNSR